MTFLLVFFFQVPFCSAMISLTNPFAEKKYSLDNKIACIDGSPPFPLPSPTSNTHSPSGFDPQLQEEIFDLGGKSKQHALQPSWFPTKTVLIFSIFVPLSCSYPFLSYSYPFILFCFFFFVEIPEKPRVSEQAYLPFF